MAFKATNGSGANSFQGFRAFVSRNPPSFNNLYWVRFRSAPKILGGSAFFSDFFSGNNGDSSGLALGGPGSDNSRLITYYANDVTVPSRQITTGDARTVGSMYRYPTGTTFSEISINFTVSRDMKTRMFFERWMNYMTEDSGNRVSWYDDCVCPFLDIFKYERGGVNPTNDQVTVVSPTGDKRVKNTVKWNKVTGVWALSNVFPFNISNVQLSNGPAATMNMEVSFYYERYRFYQPSNSGVESVPDSLGPQGSQAAAAGIAAAVSQGTQIVNGAASTATTITPVPPNPTAARQGVARDATGRLISR